jgi:hypothetical protein
MGSKSTWIVVFGVGLLAACAAPAQDAATGRDGQPYFQSGEVSPARPRAVGEPPGPFAWSKVDPRFRIVADDLSAEVGAWARTSGRTGEAGPALAALADALDAMPRAHGARAVGTADAIRSIASEMERDPREAVEQRSSMREALVIAAGQMSIDAHQSYAADPNVAREVGELTHAAFTISDAGHDASVERALSAAQVAIHAFAIAVASGRVTIPSG